MWGYHQLFRRGKHGQTLLSSYEGKYHKKLVFSKEHVWSWLAHNLEPATLSNPTKGRGAKCIPIAYHRLNLRLLAIFHCRWKNTLRLKSRHIIALSLKRLKERSYTRTTHSKTLKSSSPVCIQIGLNTLVELDYVGPKNCKFRMVP